MEDLVEDFRAGICDDGGERCYGIMLGHVYSLVLRFHFFSLLSNMTSVTSSEGTPQAAKIMGGGRSGGGWLGALGMRRPERVWKRDGSIVRKECPWMPPANVEGKVVAHALSAVC